MNRPEDVVRDELARLFVTQLVEAAMELGLWEQLRVKVQAFMGDRMSTITDMLLRLYDESDAWTKIADVDEASMCFSRSEVRLARRFRMDLPYCVMRALSCENPSRECFFVAPTATGECLGGVAFWKQHVAEDIAIQMNLAFEAGSQKAAGES